MILCPLVKSIGVSQITKMIIDGRRLRTTVTRLDVTRSTNITLTLHLTTSARNFWVDVILP